MTVKTGSAAAKRGRSTPSAAAVPQRRLSIPLLVVAILLVGAGGIVAFMFMKGGGPQVAVLVSATASATGSSTAPPTFTFTPTATETAAPTATPLPPAEYTVAIGDTCVAIAAEHHVSSQSIILLNGLDPNCNLVVGRVLLIPQPTPTPTPLPTATLGAVVATQVPRTTYEVHAGDTLLGIAKFYGIPLEDLMRENGITDSSKIVVGQTLIIPLEFAVTPGPSPTPTPPPPWPAPNQLVPADGQAFDASHSPTLQWTAVGTLRADEQYFVSIEDVTCNCARLHEQPVTETKLTVPAAFRHTDSTFHVYRWTVTTVRLKPGSSAANPQYDSAGATSSIRDFIWMGGSSTPAP